MTDDDDKNDDEEQLKERCCYEPVWTSRDPAYAIGSM
jgi:hypothetical protein